MSNLLVVPYELLQQLVNGVQNTSMLQQIKDFTKSFK